MKFGNDINKVMSLWYCPLGVIWVEQVCTVFNFQVFWDVTQCRLVTVYTS